ncbi:hypothetical protein ARMSODRAFT_990642 [Armillaria solidipes]|uniref:CxC6 like cysteine cluster associated with KDZ domain-containing protein n=1 Tax=Armillaria solidipes TaxID=1076256 RepID=A0A2H3B3P3_9AGAR|nr:hypothetical protein ARMSODRAFT_990642 [Armillaria solidipes]
MPLSQDLKLKALSPLSSGTVWENLKGPSQSPARAQEKATTNDTSTRPSWTMQVTAGHRAESPIDMKTNAAVFCFVSTAIHIKDSILLTQDSKFQPNNIPDFLPPGAIEFLSSVCSVSQSDAVLLWHALSDTIWHSEDDVFLATLRHPDSYEEMFQKHDLARGFASTKSLWPPFQTCQNSDCQYSLNGHKLHVIEARRVVLYTQNQGVLPSWAMHFTCKGIKQMQQWTSPTIVQIGKHQYIEWELAGMWQMHMVLAWVSASNCTNIYLQSFRSHLPDGWQFDSALSHHHVYDSVVILSLLEHHEFQNSILNVPHSGECRDRYTQAMKERNNHIRLYGQPECHHFCDGCIRIYPPGSLPNHPDGLIVTSTVMDGVTIGGHTCKAHNCQVKLDSDRHHYCQFHRYLAGQCHVVGCAAPVREGQKTCIDPQHAEAKRHNSLADGPDIEEQYDIEEEEIVVDMDLDVDLDAEGRPSRQVEGHRGSVQGQGPKKDKQVLVNPGGMIIWQEIFYGAETIPSAVEMIKCAYHDRYKPNHIIFDNNCMLAKHVKNDPFFKDIGLTVDVFHFKCKHSEEDKFCQEHCNPYAFPELCGEGGKGWYFNTSIAEQTNMWFGGYHLICWEMGMTKYQFFLDEMILQRNKITCEQLTKKGYAPRYWTS